MGIKSNFINLSKGFLPICASRYIFINILVDLLAVFQRKFFVLENRLLEAFILICCLGVQCLNCRSNLVKVFVVLERKRKERIKKEKLYFLELIHGNYRMLHAVLVGQKSMSITIFLSNIKQDDEILGHHLSPHRLITEA